MIRKVILPLLVVAISVGAAMTLMATSPTLEPNTPAPIPTSVRVMDVVPHSVTMSVQSQGSVNPNVESQLIPEVSGDRRSKCAPTAWCVREGLELRNDSTGIRPGFRGPERAFHELARCHGRELDAIVDLAEFAFKSLNPSWCPGAGTNRAKSG